MHTSQAEEIEKIAQVFRDHPESFWQCNRKPAHPWDQETFLRALDDCNLVPRTDPNTASQLHRMIKAAALKFLASSSPQIYDTLAVDTVALESIGYTNPTRFFVPPEAMGKPTPDQQPAAARERHQGRRWPRPRPSRPRRRRSRSRSRPVSRRPRCRWTAASSRPTCRSRRPRRRASWGLENAPLDQDAEKNLIAERVQLVDLAQNLAVHPESRRPRVTAGRACLPRRPAPAG
jgi:hypothetical protein